MAHNKEKLVDWNKDLVYKNEAQFLEALKDSEFSEAELKEAYVKHYAKKEDKFEDPIAGVKPKK